MQDIVKPMKLSLNLKVAGKAILYREAFATQFLCSGSQDSAC